MAEFTQQDIQNLNKTLDNINTKLGAARTAGARASGSGGGTGSEVTQGFIQLYKTVSDADNAIQKPFAQVGTALQNLGDIAKGALPAWLPFGDSVKGFVGAITAGGKLVADHNQKLLDFSQGLSGSASLSIDSFSELTNQLSTANLGFADFSRVQATAANFLSSMGGELRGASGQARLLADITNVVNDDFEKLGQAGLSLVEKQNLQADSMDMMRQIGMASGTDAQTAAAAVSGAMQNMAMESNKMAALTGKDRRETLEAMAKKAKSDTSVAVSAKMIADQQGLTAEQTANLRTSLAAVETNIENAFPGAMGADMQAAIDMAARTGLDFNTALGKINPELAVALSKNKEFSNGVDDVVKTLRAGGEIDVANLGELNKKFESSVDKNYLTTMQMTSEGAALSTNIYEAMVAINAQSTEAAKNVEIDSKKLKESSQGQAANMAQVAKDALTQATNVASILATVSTELFNQKFADDSKAMRDAIKASGSNIVAGVNDARNVLMGVRSLSDDASGAMKELLGYTGEEKDAARRKLEAGLDMLGMTKEEQQAWIEAAGLQDAHAKRLSEEAAQSLAHQQKVTDLAQEMIDNAKEGHDFTEAELSKGADTIKASVGDLSSAIERIRSGVKADADVGKSTAEAGQSIAETLKSLNPQLQQQFLNQIATLDGHAGKSDAQYDKLIQGILMDKTVNLGDETKLLLTDIRDKSNTNKLVEDIINATVNKDEAGAEQTAVISKLDSILQELKLLAGKPPVTIEDRSWLEELKLIKKGIMGVKDNTN